jgi:hypothetical protein
MFVVNRTKMGLGWMKLVSSLVALKMVSETIKKTFFCFLLL